MADLPTFESIKRQVVEIVKKNLNAFGESGNDLGSTSVITYIIKTGNAPPFTQAPAHTVRALAINRAEIGEVTCSRSKLFSDPREMSLCIEKVIVIKKDESKQLCVDWRDINANNR